MHVEAFSFIAAHLPPDCTSVLEFGSRNINGTVRTLVPAVRYVGVDISDGDGVDIMADAATVEVPGDPFDVVVCAEVFEHAPDDECFKMCLNAYDHLRDGGRFIVTMAGVLREPHSAVDGGPVRDGEFYRNVSRARLEVWLCDAGFGPVSLDELGADLRAVAVK
jgi:SAM-dependent methyltransferase